ncbi:uncharacterized protein [Clytia hemisphaerica]|uniref:uncharacterized protein n=1 Tax=Clytia hemisphaerica TaxID=252671 RepID=UPI0034D4514D
MFFFSLYSEILQHNRDIMDEEQEMWNEINHDLNQDMENDYRNEEEMSPPMTAQTAKPAQKKDDNKKGKGKKNKPKKFNWLQKPTTKLIELWEEETCLYDTESRDYKDRDKKLNAIERIKKRLVELGYDMTTEDVNSKMHNLKIYYGANRNKVESSKQGSGNGTHQVFEPAWVHFESMAFLKDSFTPRPTISNLNKPAYDTDDLPLSKKSKRKKSKREQQDEEEREREEDRLLLRDAVEIMSKTNDENIPTNTDEMTSDDHFCHMLLAQLKNKFENGPKKEFLKLEIQRIVLSAMFNNGAQPQTGYQQPQTGYQQPQTSYQQPQTGFQIGYQSTHTPFQRPQPCYQQPQTSYQQSSVAHQKPSSGAQQVNEQPQLAFDKASLAMSPQY